MRQIRWMTALVFFAFAATLSAQPLPIAPTTTPANTWSRGTTLQIFGGAATASPNTTGTFGAAVGWELTHRAEIEGVAAWLSQREGTEAFAADLKLLVNLTRPATVVPYVGGGAGLYRGSFEIARTSMPPFYRRRLTTSQGLTNATFTDPTAVVAAGAHFYIARHLSIRPEAAVRFVTDQSHVYKVTTVTFGLTYHVEDHDVGTSR